MGDSPCRAADPELEGFSSHLGLLPGRTRGSGILARGWRVVGRASPKQWPGPPTFEPLAYCGRRRRAVSVQALGLSPSDGVPGQRFDLFGNAEQERAACFLDRPQPLLPFAAVALVVGACSARR